MHRKASHDIVFFLKQAPRENGISLAVRISSPRQGANFMDTDALFLLILEDI